MVGDQQELQKVSRLQVGLPYSFGNKEEVTLDTM